MDEDPNIRIKMVEKRYRKIDSILKEIPGPKIYKNNNSNINSNEENENQDITIISWGSTKGAILEAMKFLRNDNIKANFIHFNYINPFKTDLVIRLLKSTKKTIIVEQNKTLQFASIIKENTGIDIDYSFSKYSGRQMLPHEIYDKIKEVLN